MVIGDIAMRLRSVTPLRVNGEKRSGTADSCGWTEWSDAPLHPRNPSTACTRDGPITPTTGLRNGRLTGPLTVG